MPRRRPGSISAAEARRIALAAQGFAAPRPAGRGDRRHLRRILDRVGMIQIDSVNVLVRSQELPLFARLGEHRRDLIPAAADDGELFEYWGHAMCHIPVADHRLFRWKMAAARLEPGIVAIEQRRPGFLDAVLARVAAEGPVVAGDVSERRGPKGPWWDWDDGKRALEYLLWSGRLTARRRATDFARIYDLPERSLPAEHLAAPAPSEQEARSALLLKAARALGVATLGDLAAYHHQRIPAARPLVAELVEAGHLLAVEVDGWDAPAYLHPGAGTPRRITAATFVSPFDSLCWERDRLARLFGFHYRIEIYTPAPQRRYGYYVLPFLLGDQLVARVDLKADRARGALLAKGIFAEPGIPLADTAEAIAGELGTMAAWLGLERVEVGRRGELAGPVAAELGNPAHDLP